MDREKLLAFLPTIAAGSPHEQMRRPCKIAFRGASWSCATDGRRLLAVRGDSDLPLNEASDSIVKMLDAKWPIRFEYAANPVAITSFCNESYPELFEPCAYCNDAGTVRCSECNGTGEIERECTHCGDMHSCECDECDEGKADCLKCATVLRLFLNDSLFNARLLAPVVTHLPAGVVPIGQDGMEDMLVFDGGDWLAIVMPLRNALEYPDAPRLLLPNRDTVAQEQPA